MGTNSISDAAVRGVSFGTNPEPHQFLARGDLPGLLAFRKAQFGGYSMVEDDDNDGDDDGDDTGDGDDGDDGDDDDDDDQSSAKDKEIESLKAENKRRRLKAREQDAALKALQKQVAALTKGKSKAKDDDGDDGDADDSSEKVAELEQDRETLLGANESLRIENAFLQNTEYTWKNPKSALRLLDRSDIEISDDGQVEGLDDALDALAKSDPYLLADAKKDDEDEDEEPRRRRTTGQPTKQKSRTKGNPNRDSLLKKYPALNR